MSTLPGKKRAYQDHLRYKHMVARLSKLPAYKQEAALVAELARGKRWRIDAAIEALFDPAGDHRWDVDIHDLFKMVGRYGRLTAFTRLADLYAFKPYDYATAKSWTPASNDVVHRCFDEAVIHGHYRVAEACRYYGARTDVFLDSKMTEHPRAMHVAISDKDLRKIDYLLGRGGDAGYSLFTAILKADADVVTHLLDRGADPNYASPYGEVRPLSQAVRYSKYDIFDLLVARGADVTQGADDMYGTLLQRHTLDTKAVLHLRDAGVPVSEKILAYARQKGVAGAFEDVVVSKPANPQPKR